MPLLACPLCLNKKSHLYHVDSYRDYYQCAVCELVFVPPHQHLSIADEKAIYDLHQNHDHDEGYRRFLSRLSQPVLERLPANAQGLDFGCGPGPVLAEIFREQGHDVKVYDPFYAPDRACLDRRYDFVTATEVVEHFRQPAHSFDQLFSLIKTNGILALMTKLVIDAEAFSRWHYKNDQTHVSFYSKTTLHWLASHYRRKIDILGKDVMIFH